MISVVVCTYNRAESLRTTLESLARMEVPADLSWELIVVDNNSTDNSHAVVEEFARTSGLRVNYVFEPRRGKSYALNTAIRTTKGSIVAFLDDDVLPEAGWLTKVWTEFSVDEELAVLSGRVELANPLDLPLTIVTNPDRKVTISYMGMAGLIIGCSAAVRRSVLAAVGDYDILLGPGSKFRAAEDLDYLYRISKQGFKMLYAPSIVVLHNHGRRTAKAERSLRRAYNIGAGAVYGKHFVSGDVFAAKLMYWVLYGRARELLRGKDVARNCRNTFWLTAGFVGCAACQCWRAVRK